MAENVLASLDTGVTKALRLYHQVQNASSPFLYASSVRALAGLLFAWIALSIAAGVFSGIVLSRTRRWWEPVLFWLVGEKARERSRDTFARVLRQHLAKIQR